MKPLITAAVLAIASTAPAWAQPGGDPHAGHRAATPAASADALTDGEVRKLDLASGKVTLKHGEIRNLGMPPMTMVFGVRDKALLDKLKVGDRVRFQAVSDAGVLTLTALQVVR